MCLFCGDQYYYCLIWLQYESSPLLPASAGHQQSRPLSGLLSRSIWWPLCRSWEFGGVQLSPGLPRDLWGPTASDCSGRSPFRWANDQLVCCRPSLMIKCTTFLIDQLWSRVQGAFWSYVLINETLCEILNVVKLSFWCFGWMLQISEGFMFLLYLLVLFLFPCVLVLW